MSFSAGPTLMPLTAGLGPAARRAVKITGALLTAMVLALVLHNAGLLGGPHLDELFNVWVYCGIELLVCALVLTRALTIRAERAAWLALAFATMPGSVECVAAVAIFCAGYCDDIWD